MRFAWYGAQDANRIFAAEVKFGKYLDFRAVVQPNKTSDIGGTTNWLFASDQPYLAKLIDGAEKGRRKIWWSIAPFGQDGNWGSAATGSYDGQWSTLLNNIVAVEARNDNTSGPIEFRLAFEYNGDWFWWKAAGNEANFKSAWVRYWNLANSIAPGRFQFELAPSETTQLQGAYADPAACWPGDQYVQKCGLDIYWKPFSQEEDGWTQWGKDANTAWNSALNAPLGLTWLKNLSAAHGNKPMVISEWGVKPAIATTDTPTVNTEPYIRQFGQWCLANNVSTLYWNGYANEGFTGDVITHDNWLAQRQAIQTNFVDVADNTLTAGGGSTGGSTGGETGGVTKALISDPYDACTQINSLTYNKTSLTAAEIAQLNDISYGPLVASGLKTDATYPVTPLVLGDVTELQADNDALTTELATATGQVSTLQSQVNSLNTQLTAQKAATKTATDNYNAAQAEVDSLTTQLATVTAERDQLLANGGGSSEDLAAAQAEIDSLNAQLTTAQDDLAAAQAQIAALEQSGAGDNTDMVAMLTKLVQIRDLARSAIPADQQRDTQIDESLEAAKLRIADALAAINAADTANGTNS